MELLWKLESNFRKDLEKRTNIAKYDKITIKELLDLGFNNNWLILSSGEEIELGFIDENGERSEELNEEQLGVRVYMKENFGWYDDEDLDNDGYHIAKVYCFNKFDEELFEVL